MPKSAPSQSTLKQDHILSPMCPSQGARGCSVPPPYCGLFIFLSSHLFFLDIFFIPSFQLVIFISWHLFFILTFFLLLFNRLFYLILSFHSHIFSDLGIPLLHIFVHIIIFCYLQIESS